MSTDIFRVDEYDAHMPEPYEIGHNVAITEKAPDEDLNCPVRRVRILKKLAKRGKLVCITNVDKIYNKVTSVASGSLPAAAANFDLGDVSDWLETSGTTFYDVNVGFITSQYGEWEVSYPQGQQLGGTKETTAVRLTEDDSSYFDPKLNFLVFERHWIPSFKLYNQSQYTYIFAKIKAIGWKYDFVKVEETSVTSNMKVSWRVLEEVKVG